LLDPDPWKRLTAFQAVQHPFLTGNLKQLRKKTQDMKFDPKEENLANLELDVVWQAPWDPSICRRKLLNVQKLREKQQAMRRGLSARHVQQGNGFAELGMPADRRRSYRNDLQAAMDQFASNGSSKMHNMPGQANVVPDPSKSPEQVQAFRRSSSDQYGLLQSGPSMAASLSNLAPSEKSHLVLGANLEVDSTGQSHMPRPINFGARSFTGTDEARLQPSQDFAYALQRPGVVPGTGTGSSSPATSLSQSAHHVGVPTGLQASGQDRSTNRAAAPSQGYLMSQQSAQPPIHLGAGFSQPLMQSFPVQVPLQQNDGYGNSLGVYPGVQQQQPSNPNQYQQQFGMQQQVHQQQMSYQIPPGQQPMQQVYLAGAPGGGYYYVTISSTGQPLLLQPVGLMNQPLQGNLPGMGYSAPQQQQQQQNYAPTLVAQQDFQQQQGWMDPYYAAQQPLGSHHFQQQQAPPQQHQRHPAPPAKPNPPNPYSQRGGASM
jgi:hypothetical protein